MSKLKLTEHQQPVFDAIWEFIERGDPDGYYMALLAAPAGAGKSFLTIELVKKVLHEALFNNIAVCSPTHKSLRVIKEMLPPDERSKVTFSTIHSLLGLRHKITNNGKEVFERDKNQPCKFGLYDVVIVDESSMLSDELFYEMEKQNYRGVKILFVGDPNQINPVNHEHSIPMLEEKRAEFKIRKFELTEIVRQAKGNPIIETSQQILRNEFKFQMGEKQMSDGKGWAMLNRHQPEVINEILKYYFCSKEFDENANHCKLIAWRNVTVDNFNKLIRGMKYGLNAPKIVVGEKLIVDKPIKGDTKEEILFNTNEDLVVTELVVKTKNIGGQTFKYYDARVIGDEQTANIHILHESSNRLYEMCLKKLADDAKGEKDSYKRGKLWSKYFEFQDNFSSVDYNFALTVHKCISKDMRVNIKNRGLIPISEVEVGDFIKNSKGFNKILNKWESGKKKEYVITTHSGYELKCSSEHKLLTVENEEFSFKAVKDLKETDIVCLDRREEDTMTIPDTITPTMAWFLGLLVGDGNYSGNTKKGYNRVELSVYGEDLEVEHKLRKLEEEYKRYDLKINRYDGGYSKEMKRQKNMYRLVIDNRSFRDYLHYELGLHRGLIKENKYTPTIIWKSSKEKQALYIRGFIDSDGSIDRKAKSIRLVNKSDHLIKETQLLLLSQGISSQMSLTSNKRYNVLSITGPSLTKYKNNIGFGVDRKQKMLIEETYEKIGKTNIDNIPFKTKIKNQIISDFGDLCGDGMYEICPIFASFSYFSYKHLDLCMDRYYKHNEKYKKEIPMPPLMDYLRSSYILFEPIKHIKTFDKEVDMFDIEVEHEHEFTANGFITHNCQGSTYTNTFVVYTDIMLNRNEEERQRILYTACTRPKEMLYFM